MAKSQRVALVYDRVNKWGGAERVLLALHELFPKADLFTSVYDKKGGSWARVFPQIHTSFLQQIPFAKRNHEYLAPLMPIAFESFNFSDYDLVISVSSEAAKGIITNGHTVHISYCLTPTRYLWSGYDNYFAKSLLKTLSSPAVAYLRHWDQMAAQRADHMIGISSEVKSRIKQYYKRDSKIIFPPVEISKFSSSKKSKKEPEYFLLVSRLVKYKRVDLAVEAFNKLKLPLVIVGTGKQEKYLKKIAKKNIKFVGQLTDLQLQSYYSGARALIFPQFEDFGLVAVEAQAAGIPVIAYDKGGARDTVIHGKTGVFFEAQTVDSLIKAVKTIDKIKFNRENIYENAQRFSKERFLQEFKLYLKPYTS